LAAFFSALPAVGAVCFFIVNCFIKGMQLN
jgi:hypothetical protein